MTADLPAGVRDRAARAAFETMRKFRVGASWLVTVELTNAVGAVLVAEQSVALREMARRSVHNRAAANELFARSGRRARKLTAERDALKARVDLLSTLLRAMARRATGLRQNARRAVSREMGYRLSSGETVAEMRHRQTMSELRAERLQARVDLLTTALTEIVVIVNHSSLSMSSTTTDLLLRSVNRASAVLSATPTGEAL